MQCRNPSVCQECGRDSDGERQVLCRYVPECTVRCITALLRWRALDRIVSDRFALLAAEQHRGAS